ncbi:MAG: UvrD-helicase domain-containing protein, partial [Lentisphaeria bacterium]|nr:UvrD-helicase domain-containing protein [Lentisphaeria bacterium]
MASAVASLNPCQKEAATTIEGPLLVLAGAGTGKTKVITCRIAYMIEQGIPPDWILGVTFTNKAAREMRERLDQMVPPELSAKVTLGTFHSFCARILHRFIHLAGHYNSSFSIADDADQVSLARQAAAELGYSKEEIDSKAVVGYISRKKNDMQWPADALAADSDNYQYAAFARIYERYQQMLELQNTLDFDDMLLITLKLLDERPEVLKYCQDHYRYLLVDEYQDTNQTQFRIIQLIAGEKMNLCVVGDDDQSIYSWRGAVVSNILDFPKLFPGAKEIKLEQNYRSTNAILQTANAIISENSARYDKNLWSAKGQGEPVRVFRVEDGEAEARFVVDVMEQILSREPDRCWSDFAVLFRSNHLSRSFEQELRARGVNPRIIGGQAFFQRKEVKDAAAYLKLLINARDDQSLLRILSVPPRGLGDKAILTLRDLQNTMKKPLLDILGSAEYHGKITKAAANAAGELAGCIRKFVASFAEPGNLSERVHDYLIDVGYLTGLQKIYKNIEEAEKRQENVAEFISYIGVYERRQDAPCTLAEFMESYSLMDDNDRTDDSDNADGPVLSTVHASKGLEFPIVFIVGMEQGLFPHERALMENGEEEERRLFYVAVTRAREELFMTSARARFKYHELVR